MAGWRYLLQRFDGSGWGQFLHTDLPLTDVSIINNLTATDELTATVAANIASLKDVDGLPLFDPYRTAVWAESENQILGGGILVSDPHQANTKNLRCIGLSGYPHGMPYTGSWFGVEIDPLDVHRQIWSHLQGEPGGNIELQIDDTTSGLKIGVELEQAEFDTESGPIAYEAGPVKLNWYETHDLGQTIADLAETTPYDYREVHWWDGNEIKHKQEIGYPRLGNRLTSLRFVVGENIIVPPNVEPSSTGPVTDVMVLGAGNGRTMIRGYAAHATGRIRRVLVHEQKNVRVINSANRLAEARLKELLVAGSVVSNVTLRNHPSAPISAIRPGDEIPLQLDDEWTNEFIWCRVQSITLQPDQSDDAQLSLVRSDQVA